MNGLWLKRIDPFFGLKDSEGHGKEESMKLKKETHLRQIECYARSEISVTNRYQ